MLRPSTPTVLAVGACQLAHQLGTPAVLLVVALLPDGTARTAVVADRDLHLADEMQARIADECLCTVRAGIAATRSAVPS